MSSRALTKIAVVAAIALVVALTVGVSSHQGPLDPSDPEDFALRLDALLAGPAGNGPPRPTTLSLRAWTSEIVPWMAEEGIADFPNRPIPTWRFYEDDTANHVLGQSDCEAGLWINARFINPASPWFADVSFLSTLTHELIHAQQGITCDTADRDLVETTAQVASLEVMAAMANNGNRAMAYALVDELLGITLGELRFRALGDKVVARRLESLLRRIDDDPWEQAERKQRRRFWEARPAEQSFVLRAYAHGPYTLLVKALRDGKLGDLALPPVVAGWDPQTQRDALRTPMLAFDDLNYFLKHAEEMLA